MTPTRVAAGTSEAQAMPGRGRNPFGGKNGDFGAILSDVVQEESPDGGAPAEGKRTSTNPAPAAARTPASTVALPLDVDALLARMAKPSSAGNPTVQAPAPKTQDDKSKSRDKPDCDEPSAAKDRAASMDLLVAAGAVAAQATPSLAATAIAADAKQSPTNAVAKLAEQTTSGPPNVADAMSPRDSDPINQLEARPASVSADTATAAVVATRAIASTQVALVEVASHLMPARPAPPDKSDAASVDAVGTNSAKTTAAEVSKPVKAALATPDADDGRADHEAVAAPILAAAEATAAAMAHPVRQIGDAVTALAADASRPEPGAAQAAATSRAPARSLVLQLAPATLGAITVRLHLTDGGLSVHLAVEDQATLGLISHSREALQAAIGATYKLNQLVIHGADTAPPTPAGSNESTTSDGGTLADQRSGGQRGNERDSQKPSGPVPREVRAVDTGRSDGLFL